MLYSWYSSNLSYELALSLMGSYWKLFHSNNSSIIKCALQEQKKKKDILLKKELRTCLVQLFLQEIRF